MPAISFSDQPDRGPHPVDHDPHRRAGSALAQVDQPAGEPGQSHRVGRAHHDDLVGLLERGEGQGVAAGAAAEVGAGSSSRLKPVSTTT